jgi:DNA-directed RNA polymerase specialized sigma24 family protein
LPYAEISNVLQVPVGTVRSRIHRGRALLREALR